MNTTDCSSHLSVIADSVAEELLTVRKDASRTDWQLTQHAALKRRAALVRKVRERMLTPSGAGD